MRSILTRWSNPKIRNVSVGVRAVWIVTEDRQVYVRTGIGDKSAISRKVSTSSFYNSYETFLTGTKWVDMDAKMDYVAIGYNDQVFSIGVGGKCLYFRAGVDANEPKGKCWELIKSINDASGIPADNEDLDAAYWISASVSGIMTEYSVNKLYRSSLRSSNSPAHALRNSDSSDSIRYNDKYREMEKLWKSEIISKLQERKEKEMSVSFLDSYQESIDVTDPISPIKSGMCKYVNPNNNQLIDAKIDIGKSDYSSTGIIKIVTSDKKLIKEETINFIDITCIYTQVNSDKNFAHSFIVIRTFKDGSVKILFINDNDFNEWFKVLNELINQCFIDNQMLSKFPDFWTVTLSGDIYQGFKITEQDYFVKYTGGGHFEDVSSCGNSICGRADQIKNRFASAFETAPPLAYAITSDGHLYHYTTLGDHFPIIDTVTYYIYENQRWNPLTGYSNFARLPTDRSNWTDESGRVELSKDSITLPSRNWKWFDNSNVGTNNGSRRGMTEISEDGWTKDINETPGGTNCDGWQFALDFPFSYHPEPRMTDTVRRRRWFRKCAFETNGPWLLIEPVLIKSASVCETFWDEESSEHSGNFTPNSEKEPQTPIDADSVFENFPKKNETFALWAISLDGTALCRTNVTRDNPSGDHWIPINCPKKLTAVSISFSSDLKLSVWTVAEDGSLFLRSGIFKEAPDGVDWFQVEPPKIKCPLVSICVGANLVTAIDFKGRLWKRVNVVHSLPMGTGWFKVTKNVNSVAISQNEKNDTAIVVKKGSAVNLLSFIYDDKSNGWKQLKIPNIFTKFTFHPCNE